MDTEKEHTALYAAQTPRHGQSKPRGLLYKNFLYEHLILFQGCFPYLTRLLKLLILFTLWRLYPDSNIIGGRITRKNIVGGKASS